MKLIVIIIFIMIIIRKTDKKNETSYLFLLGNNLNENGDMKMKNKKGGN